MYFVLLRLIGYTVAYAVIALTGGPQPWWRLVLGALIVSWGVWDRWKRPDDSLPRLRLGVWSEFLTIISWSLLSHSSVPLFLLVSPLMRSCVHLLGLESVGLGLLELSAILAMQRWLPFQPDWLLWAQLAAILVMGPYAYVMGALVRERETARRQLALATLEQEQRLKSAERIRLARQLHDVMGQYWTAVIRGLDVALVTSGDQQRVFLTRAHEAADQGLQAMRTAVHDWNDGHQSPEAWLEELATSVDRFQQTVGISITLDRAEIDWSRFADGVGAAEAITRVALESLTNAIRHGQASSVSIRVATDASGVSLQMLDDGIGLNPGQSGGLGVQSMRDLAANLGGALQIESAHGTSVTLRLPYAAQGAIA